MNTPQSKPVLPPSPGAAGPAVGSPSSLLPPFAPPTLVAMPQQPPMDANGVALSPPASTRPDSEREQQLEAQVAALRRQIEELQLGTDTPAAGAAAAKQLDELKDARQRYAQMVSVLLRENAALRINNQKALAEARAERSASSSSSSSSGGGGGADPAAAIAAALEAQQQLLRAAEARAKNLEAQLKQAQQQQQNESANSAELQRALARNQELADKVEQLQAKNTELAATAQKAADALASLSVKFKSCTQLCAEEKERANQAVAMATTLRAQLDEQKRRGDSLEQANAAIKEKVDKLLTLLRAQGWQLNAGSTHQHQTPQQTPQQPPQQQQPQQAPVPPPAVPPPASTGYNMF